MRLGRGARMPRGMRVTGPLHGAQPGRVGQGQGRREDAERSEAKRREGTSETRRASMAGRNSKGRAGRGKTGAVQGACTAHHQVQRVHAAA